MENKVRIDEINFQNYRQYGTCSIKFSHSKKHELFVFVARNGTGKTTFLNAITWCLYEKEELLDETKTPLPIVNSSVLSNSSDGDIIPVSVSLRIVDNESFITFCRTQKVKVIKKNAEAASIVVNSSDFVITKTKIGDQSNSQTIENADANMIVKQYFDSDIYDFYFFDGENLKNYFAKGRSEKIKESIYNIAQVTLLNNTIDHITTLKKEKLRALAKTSSALSEHLEKQEQLLNEKNDAANQIKSLKEKLDEATFEIDKIDDILRDYKPITSLQEERKAKEKKIKEIENEEKAFHTDLSQFIREYYIYIKFYPAVKKVLDYINAKEKDGKLPPEIDTKLIERIINDMGDTCPVCDQSVVGDAKKHALQHLEELLKKFDISSATSNYLVGLRPSLIQIEDYVEQYKAKRDSLKDREINIKNRLKDENQRLETISNLLSNYEKKDDPDSIDVSELENQRRDLYSNTITWSTLKGSYETILRRCEKDLKDLEPLIQKETNKQREKEDLKKQVQILQKLESDYSIVRDIITTKMREEIQSTTERNFRKMSSKKNTFGNITIDEEYNVEVFSLNGQKMTGSLSATEQMALAYSFTLAIHKASGKNCPLVIDSPLGRVSDKNRENMARTLYDMSTYKQIIMLFTPDEFSKDVKDIYEKNTTVTELGLSEDESRIESGVSKNGTER